MTGQPAYREWALKTLAWLDAKLYDRRAGLYRWSVHYADLDQREGEVVANRFFNYDQGILIEAHLLAYALLGEDPARLGRARSLGRATDKLFWDARLGGYDLEAGVPQVFPVYSAWLSQSFLALYASDRDPFWLARAGANLDALDRNAWDAAHGGYYQRYYLCRDPNPPGCADGVEQSADPEKLLVDQAWMQRTQALLARALLSDTERDAPKGGT
jgi:uncharacterized protein YyaL (SSP411 family)